MKKRSFAVLGLGKYGQSLARNLYELGMDVLVCDRDPDIISDFSESSTVALCCDLSNEDDVTSLNLGNMDAVIVAMGQDFHASTLCVLCAKEQGVPLVVAKASSQRMATILRRIGADRIIEPEAEMGVRSARILASPTIFDYFDMDENLCLIEMTPEPEWIGKALLTLELRRKRGVNVIAIRSGDSPWSFVDPQFPLPKDARLLVALEKKNLSAFQ